MMDEYDAGENWMRRGYLAIEWKMMDGYDAGENWMTHIKHAFDVEQICGSSPVTDKIHL